MTFTAQDRRIFVGLSVGLTLVLGWGLVSGDVQSLLRKPDAGGPEVRRQKALDHVFGSDASFNPTADMVADEAEGSGDTLSWKRLADTQMQMEGGVPKKVTFGKDIQALNGKTVTISGYMFPLQASGGQEHFLLSAYPPSCPYCLPGGPTELIEVSDSEALPFTYERITVEGIFQLLNGDDLQGGMFYRLSHIHLVK